MSRSLARHLARLEARNPEALAVRLGTPKFELLEPMLLEPPHLDTVDVDPSKLVQLHNERATRAVDRPSTVERHLEEVTPQFTLRNTWRLEMYGDAVWLELSRTDLARFDLEGYLSDVHACRFERPTWFETLNTDRLVAFMAQQRALVVDTPWHEAFGRPNPVGGLAPQS